VNKEKKAFIQTVWGYYKKHGRHTQPWRENPSAYNVVMSEIMLQQTQVSRVLPKFLEWKALWPDWESLAGADLVDVYKVWKGLGYNNRAKRLWEIAKTLKERNYKLPATRKELMELPGIGEYTSGAILAFVHNKPVIFIDTNIRRVFIHHFFSKKETVHDKELLPLIKETLDKEKPREWYWALFDYGSHLKSLNKNPNKQSVHYTVQSPLKGSVREVRAHILEYLTDNPTHKISSKKMKESLPNEMLPRFDKAIQSLEKDGIISTTNTTIVLKS
jgi:A/G-specific adenine glycosylase